MVVCLHSDQGFGLIFVLTNTGGGGEEGFR